LDGSKLPSTIPTPCRDKILALIETQAGQVNMLVVPRVFIDITGSHVLALMLSQLLYWSDRAKRRDGFVYKSARDWYLEVGASEYAVGKFNRLPYIETKVKRANGSPTTHYRINFEKLSEIIRHFSPQNQPGVANEIAEYTNATEDIDRISP
jgi:hypothetical protein